MVLSESDYILVISELIYVATEVRVKSVPEKLFLPEALFSCICKGNRIRNIILSIFLSLPFLL